MRRVLLSAVLLATAAGGVAAAQTADLVLRDPIVHTLDPARPRAAAVAVRGSRILAVGSLQELKHLVGPETRVRDLEGRTVVPGFDAPLHLPATVTLYFALLLSVASMVLLIASGAVSEDGACDSPALVAGDLLMYPEGDTSAAPSGRMPKGGYFFDAIIRQEPIEEDKLDPADNLEELYGFEHRHV